MFVFLQNVLLLKVITSPASATVTSPGFVNDKFILREEISAVTPRHRRKHYRNVTIQQSSGDLAVPGAVLHMLILAPMLLYLLSV